MRFGKLTWLLFLCVCSAWSQDAEPVDEYAIKDVNYFSGDSADAGNATTYHGNTTNGPTWDRPLANGTCCSTLGPVAYEMQFFTVDVTGTYDISSIQDGWDGYIFVYDENFNPNDPLAGFIAGDDDGPGGVGTSEILGVTLEAWETYFVVTTGFAALEEGSYANTIEGPGGIHFYLPWTPTLGEWGMIGFVGLLLGAGLIVIRRSKMQ